MATHSSVLAWRIPGTGGAWWAAVCGVAQSQTRLKQLSSSSNISRKRIQSSGSQPGPVLFSHVWRHFWLSQRGQKDATGLQQLATRGPAKLGTVPHRKSSVALNVSRTKIMESQFMVRKLVGLGCGSTEHKNLRCWLPCKEAEKSV